MAARARGALSAALLFFFATLAAARAEPVTIFAASSTAELVTALAARFEAESGAAVRTNFAASSTLARQIEGGAPAHVYLSADQAWMDYLQARGLVAAADRRPFLRGALVLVRPKRARPLPRLADPGFVAALDGGRLAIGDPAHVPAGRYAEAALRHLGLWSALRERTAPMGSVREALALVARGETPAGIVYATDARITADVAIAEEIPAAAHPPILYPIARLARTANAAADRFMRFLDDPDTARIAEAHGFHPLGRGG